MVEVKVFGPLWDHLAPSLELDPDGREIDVAALIALLEIDPAEVGIVTVNRRQSHMHEKIPAGSRVCIFPPMSGG